MDDKIFQVNDNFSWVKGKHSPRFGGEYRYDESYEQIGSALRVVNQVLGGPGAGGRSRSRKLVSSDV